VRKSTTTASYLLDFGKPTMKSKEISSKPERGWVGVVANL